MSYNDESDLQRAHQQPGADPTEAYQATAEWDAATEEGSWDQGAGDGNWEEAERPLWERQDDPDSWDPVAEQQWDEEHDEAPSGVTAAKQSISGAADKITRWFAGLDRRPEYEDQVRGADPVAELTPPAPASERAPGLARERGATPGRLAAASRAAAANRRRSVAAGRDGGSSAGAFGRGSAHAARGPRGDRDRRPVAPLPADEPVEPLPELMGGDGSSRFPVAPLGYNRQAVDEQFAELEDELTQLREALAQESHGEAPMSIQEELERIGEETASILVVAHDKAHETTQMAQEQAERCVADAAANAVSITEKAKRKLDELAAETDGVSHRRARLIADVRNISGSLQSLADEAEQRFADDEPPAKSAVEAQPVVDAPAEPAMHGPVEAA
jgi:cell division septum initiation protein DivIVA